MVRYDSVRMRFITFISCLFDAALPLSRAFPPLDFTVLGNERPVVGKSCCRLLLSKQSRLCHHIPDAPGEPYPFQSGDSNPYAHHR